MSAAERQRRYRKRQARGAVSAIVEIPNSVAEKLIACGYLAADDVDNLRKRGDALTTWIMRHLKNL